MMCHNKMPHKIASDCFLAQMTLADCQFLDKKNVPKHNNLQDVVFFVILKYIRVSTQWQRL